MLKSTIRCPRRWRIPFKMLTLKPYQRDAVGRMRNGCILCGGVGSGKSVTSLTYYFEKNGGKMEDGHFTQMSIKQDLYIITTARKRDTREWEKELSLFLLHPDLPDLPVKVVVDSWNNIGKYAGITGAFFLFDEQRVVGHGAWVKSFLKISRHNEWILLSATPGDCWSDYIPVFIANGFYRNRTEFATRHIVYSRFAKYPKVDHYVDCAHLAALRRKIMVDMDYRRDTEAHHEDIICSYDRDAVKEAIRLRWNPYTREPMKDAGELCYVMRHIVNSDPSRFEQLEKLIDNHKAIIIYYNYDYELELLRCFLSKRIPYAEWNGHRHEPIPDGNRWAYLVQYTAGAEGWNCVRTDTIVFFSQNYSYKIMVQAAGRIDRMNTPFHDLYYYHLRSTAPIDLAIRKALNEKKDFNEKKFANW